MTLALTVFFGAIVGLALGALGGGGSILVVPALVYVFDVPPQSATNLSQTIVAITSLFALMFHWSSGRIRWPVALFLASAGALGAALGREAVHAASDIEIMICLAVVSITIALLMLRQSWVSKRNAQTSDASPDDHRPRFSDGSPSMFGLILIAGVGVGFLTGFLGVGGGILTVPLLVLVLGFSMQSAIATSLMVIALNCTASLLYDWLGGGVQIQWNLAIPFMSVAMIGTIVGYRGSRHLSEATLQRWFGVMVILLGTMILIGNLALAAGWLPSANG